MRRREMSGHEPEPMTTEDALQQWRAAAAPHRNVRVAERARRLTSWRPLTTTDGIGGDPSVGRPTGSDRRRAPHHSTRGRRRDPATWPLDLEDRMHPIRLRARLATAVAA